jgi:hypothetical protein
MQCSHWWPHSISFINMCEAYTDSHAMVLSSTYVELTIMTMQCFFLQLKPELFYANLPILLLLQNLGPEHLHRMHCSHRLIVQPWNPHLYLDVPTFAARCLHVLHDARDPSSERWNFVGEHDPVILPKCRLPRYIQGSFTCRKSTTWNWQLYFPSEGRHAEDFSPLKILMASAGFEPANLGT